MPLGWWPRDSGPVLVWTLASSVPRTGTRKACPSARGLGTAVRSFKTLARHFDVYVLSTAPWKNHSAWSDKVRWVKSYLGKEVHKRLILSHHKNLNKGHFIIDDRLMHGVEKFEGEHICFGRGSFKTWKAVVKY